MEHKSDQCKVTYQTLQCDGDNGGNTMGFQMKNDTEDEPKQLKETFTISNQQLCENPLITTILKQQQENARKVNIVKK